MTATYCLAYVNDLEQELLALGNNTSSPSVRVPREFKVILFSHKKLKIIALALFHPNIFVCSTGSVLSLFTHPTCVIFMAQSKFH